MAQLKDTVVQGSLRATDTIYTNDFIMSASKSATYILAAPNTTSGAPTFRALTSTDLPTIPISKGGTGTTATPTRYGVIYAGTTTSYASTSAGTAGYILIGAGSAAPLWSGAMSLTGTSASDWIATVNGKLRFGTTATFGTVRQPVYWNDGKPATCIPMIKVPFSINSGNTGVQLESNEFLTTSQVLEIVITDNPQFLNGPLTASCTAAGVMNITSTTAVGGSSTAVSGYILVSIGEDITVTSQSIS